ncbi:pentatricopeptide repeat-containing protein At2g17670 isoform X2 [Henckelia pumila]|uniref:pentatricopeptide repeat-containing protein At2g17670 isoform X2 n=1 Tax=Henckelia pumila TaxID=405737 RepID=UPI003C6E7A6A
MGKVPTGFRRAVAGSSQSALFKASNSSASILQEQIPPPITPLQSHKKSSKKEPTKVIAPAKKSNTPPIIFESSNLSEAKALFNSYISSLKYTPSDPSFYNSILQSYSSISSPQNAIFFLNHMIKTRPSFSPNRFTYQVLLVQSCALPDETSLANVHNTLNFMKNTGFPPNQVTADVAVRTLSGCGREEHAIELFKDLSSQNVLPDTYTYNFLEEGVKPDRYTYNTLIYGLSKTGMVKEARKFLAVMSEMGHFPDEVTYTSLMNGMCRQGDALGALALLEEMEAKGCVPNSCTYNTLLHGLCKARLLDKGVELYGVMKKGDLKLETGCYGTFLRALCRNGRVAEAYEVFDYAVESKSLKDVTAYSTLETSLKWLRKAREQGLAV